MVTVEYHIAPAKAAAFQQAARELEAMRKRNGALYSKRTPPMS